MVTIFKDTIITKALLRILSSALAYYRDHFQEIRQQIQEDEIFAREMQRKTPSVVQQKKLLN